MTKRFLSIVFAAVLLMTALAVPTALAEENSYSNGAGEYYVYTENGKGLNVRETPGGKVVGSLKYGSRIYVETFSDENWALITFRYDNGYGMGDYAAFVNRRFLRKSKPPARTGTKKETPAPTDPFNDMNAEYRSAVHVEKPYQVILRPTRVSGWVPMHWGPSNETEIVATYKANSVLTVIHETNNWLQVQDDTTGNVGFISKTMVVQ